MKWPAAYQPMTRHRRISPAVQSIARQVSEERQAHGFTKARIGRRVRITRFIVATAERQLPSTSAGIFVALATLLVVVACIPPAPEGMRTLGHLDARALYHGASVPVWVVVRQEGQDTVRVDVAVMWDDRRSGLRFAQNVRRGELVVSLPAADRGRDCRYTGMLTHGSKGYTNIGSVDDECVAQPIASIPEVVVRHRGSPMKCALGRRTDGIEDPNFRAFGCYWARPPGNGAGSSRRSQGAGRSAQDRVSAGVGVSDQ